MASLGEFILNLEGKVNALKDEVVESVSVVASGDDLFAIVRRAGMLEGRTLTLQELKKFSKGDSEDEDE